MTVSRAVHRAEQPKGMPFYIPATGSPTRTRYTLKHNDMFAVIDSHGDIGVAAGDPDGVFHRDTRFLSHLEFRINGTQTLLLGSGVNDDNSAMTADLTNPDILDDGKIGLAKDSIHIVRTCFVWRDTFHTRFGIRNYADRTIDLKLDLLFDNDFADIFEARGMRRARRGEGTALRSGPSEIRLSYAGLDGVSYQTRIHLDPQPSELAPGRASYQLSLDPGQRTSLFIAAGMGTGEPLNRPEDFFRSLRAMSRWSCRLRKTSTCIETSSEIFNQVLARSFADLRLLTTETEDGDYPYAGIPWYSTTFGRDGLVTALQVLWCMPSVARGVLRRLAALQATDCDPLNDAEPGKIIHEMRGGEMAGLREVPFARYYGSVDATPLFVLLAGEYAQRTSDFELLKELWPNIEAALHWIEVHSKDDRHGFLRHARNTEGGLANQGWKDSYDSVFHADGRLAEGDIALIEVQAYVIAARRSIARVAARLGHEEMAEVLRRQSDHLAAKLDEHFWCKELNSYGIALDGAGELCRVRTSNAGHVLFAGAAPDGHARRVAASLLSPCFMSGWGIRTVANGESRYNPMSYHNGSIWPHDNALIALGFGRYGLKAAAATVLEAMAGAASRMELTRLPELFCGFGRVRGRAPTLYPVACSPQAWASAAPLAMLQACLGLQFDPERNTLCLTDPVLPPLLNNIVLRNLEVGDSSVDLALMRDGNTMAMKPLRNEGNVKITIAGQVS